MPKDSSFSNSINKPHFVLAGEVVDVLRGSGVFASGDSVFRKSVSVGAMTTETFMNNIGGAGTGNVVEYSNQAAMSFDGIFSPYTTAVSHTGLPRFEQPTDSGNPNSETLNPFNPNNILSTGDNSSGWMPSGHNIGYAVVGTGIGVSGGPQDFTFEKDFFLRQRVETQDVRGIGLRAPQVMTGWGFDTAGNPVPADTGDSTKFHPDAFWDPNLWKTGPIDLRWDTKRKVWRGGGDSTVYLVKITNVYNPACFSYEVDRSDSRAQFTRNAPTNQKAFSSSDPIHDPENLAYVADSNNIGCYEQLDYQNIEFPHYEAFIIRSNSDSVDGGTYYNLWTEDCQDCGHITNSGCGTQHGSSSTDKKILIENPLRQNLDVGDLAFAVSSGRTKSVNTGSFTGGTGSGASAELVVASGGSISGSILAAGTGYTNGGFAIVSGDICTSVSLTFGTASTGLSVITITPTAGYTSGTYPMTIYPNDATVQTESLGVYWITQAEFKTQQLVSYVGCEGGLLQSASLKVQTQGFKTCEWAGEDTTYINSF